MSSATEGHNESAGKLKDASSQCLLCHRATLLTFHHLIPKTLHRNKWFRKNFSIEDMRSRGVTLCRACHSFLHKKFGEKQLGRELNTAEKIHANEIVQQYLKWARKQKR